MSNTIQLKHVWVGHYQDHRSDKIYVILKMSDGVFKSYYGPSKNLNFRQGKALNSLAACFKLENEKLNKGYVEVKELSLIKHYCAKVLGINSGDINLPLEQDIAPKEKPVEPAVAPVKPSTAKICPRAKSVSKHLDLHAGNFLTL